MTKRLITRADAEWPQSLDEMTSVDPPDNLFLQGLPLRSGERTVAVVGSRTPSAAGMEIATELTRGLAEAGFAVVSGLAVGIDSAAHRAALDAGGYTAAVLGCGLDVDYPLRNAGLRRRIAAQGTLVSEYDSGTRPKPGHFPARNRIIAGLCTAVVFVEGSERSGGLITARHAIDANRSVFAVPGSVRNPLAAGPNELIRTSQASLVTSVDQILQDLAPSLVWNDRGAGRRLGDPLVNPAEARMLLFLDDVPVPLDRICLDLVLRVGEAAMTLAALEVRGLVIKRSGGYAVTERGARLRSRIQVAEEDAAATS
ncbi:MAG: DNA-processing protein DprA [Actinomycetota bacterium]|nr:DNA-processing protein DprA [Actinomycetota bacterium]